MRFRRKAMRLQGQEGTVWLTRNSHGVPVISADSYADLAFGHGFVHANDRQLQVLLTRLVFQGRVSECLLDRPELVELDKTARRINLLPDPEEEIAKLDPRVKKQLQSYVQGFNHHLSLNKPVFELRLLGYRPEPLEIQDVISLSKVMGFVGLAVTQGNMERLILQMVKHGVDEQRIRELFPYLTDEIDREVLQKVGLSQPVIPDSLAWLGRIPRMVASNSWVISKDLTASGTPLLCNDPHLEVNRLPAIWQEVVLRAPEQTIKGAAFPGAPGVVIGRTDDLAFGCTYAFMDMIDFKIEHCRNGSYRRGDTWIPFRERVERIKPKKGREEQVVFYENDLGVLEGDPYEEGYHLLMSWAAARGCGGSEFPHLLLPEVAEVQEAMDLYRGMQSGSWCVALADTKGNIGCQMTGRLFKRPQGVSGLLPVPAWNDAPGPPLFVDQEDLPRVFNPKQKYLVTANQDLNHLGRAEPINLCMARYRAERITGMIEGGASLDTAYMQRMQNDLFSLQAERLMRIIGPLLPEGDNAALLKRWDYRYDPESRGAVLFERVYQEILLTVFGDNGLGREVMDHLLRQTSLVNDFFGNFDEVLFNPDSSWFQETGREELFRQAIERALPGEVPTYAQTRKVVLSHLLFGGKLPGWMGFDRGPVALPGGRASVLQGQIFKSMNRTTTFSPSYRMIADLGSDTLLSNLPGGVSDRRFSRLYYNCMQDWLTGTYREL